MESPPEAPPALPRKLPLLKRARSVPFKRPYIMALLFSSLFYLALIGTFAALFAFMVEASRNSAVLLIGFGGMSGFFWLVSFLRRRSCHCPLCKGTPFLDNSAHHHEKAFRLFPLNYGTTNVLRALTRQHFRCQFCGTPFDLLKPFSRTHVEQVLPPSPLSRRAADPLSPVQTSSPLSPPAA